MVYVGQAPGLLPQGAGASLGQIRFCPTGCSGRPLGGGWYRTEGLSPQGASPVFPDRPVRAQGVAEPLFPRQWNLRLARFPEAWTQATGVGVAVAVPDTGVLQGHPDLQGALLPGLDLLEGDTDPEEPPTGSPLQNFHGSHVAGILAAPWQGVGMAGASQAQVLPIRLLTPEGTGRESDLILALRWAAGIPVAGLPPNPHPVRVVNLSLAGEGPCSPALQQALDEVRARGVLVVAAAGNQGRDHRDYFPANCRGVLAVGAVGPDGRLAPYSNRGAPLLAPGGNGALGNEALVLGPTWASGFAYRLLQGTSQAAPHVAGAAALLLALRPDLGPSALEAALLLGAEATPEGRLLRADEALAALEGEGP
ncbi:S8 family serine peptidase, partial [Thermus scotoductus]|uniref:S8 family serine peptidase n=1 Tax=Thermus scotoductus TaxID=37636 RepID=UPI0010029B7A